MLLVGAIKYSRFKKAACSKSTTANNKKRELQFHELLVPAIIYYRIKAPACITITARRFKEPYFVELIVLFQIISCCILYYAKDCQFWRGYDEALSARETKNPAGSKS